MRNRAFSFLVPWFMDGSVALAQTAMPLLAVRLGASAVTLGTISWVAQITRLPVCLVSGRLSEKWGRKALAVPAALFICLVYLAYPSSAATAQVMLLYAVTMACVGAFYPSLQALIGDVSARGELTKNVGAFNIGWCVGAGVSALAAGALVRFGLEKPFYLAALYALFAGALVFAWKTEAKDISDRQTVSASSADFGPLLLIARMGMFTAFFGYAVVRILFPRVAIVALGWSEQSVAWAVSGLPVGQAAGMIATTAAPWWRGKLWPQLGAQGLMFSCAAVTAVASSPVILAAVFFGLGFALSTAYTAALYHGLSSSPNKGKNMGIHEALVAAGGIVGSLGGGVAAEKISPQAPYLMLSGMCALCLVASLVLWRKWLTVSKKSHGRVKEGRNHVD